MRKNIVILFPLFLFVFISCKLSLQQDSTNKLVYLDSLENLYEDVPDWLSTVYDSTSGGFYHNAIMVKDTLYEPDMQSTSFGLSILINGNIVDMDTVSETFKSKIKEYVISRYDSTTGLFLDPLYAERIVQSDRTLGRSQGMAAGILRKIGIKNNFVETGEITIPEYLLTLNDFKDWFYKQRWSRVWTAFDHIAMQSTFIKNLPPEKADSIIHFIQEYAEKNQNQDGLWGKGQPQEIRFSGAAKYGTFCMNMSIPLPNPDQIYKTVLKWFRDNKELDFSEYSGCPICVPRNALRLLYYVEPDLSFEIPEEDKEILVESSYKMLKYYHNRDGGFMKNRKESRIAPLDIDYGVSDSLVSDINGTHLAVTARKAIYDLLKRPIPKISMSEHIEIILTGENKIVNSNIMKTKIMNKRYFAIVISFLITLNSFCADKFNEINVYLKVVQKFADQLLKTGTDKYGSRNTAMWASVIDLKTLTVPPRNVPGTKGIRPYDRAVGGSNYYHDVMTMKVFDALSEITGDPKYTNAVKNYSRDFLNLCQNPETGLLGWGEHLYYDFYKDTVTIAENRIFYPRDYFIMPHELLGWTPPWKRLWEINPERTASAIEGIMWHFNGPDTKTYLFNRHAVWNKPEYQNVVMPWIKHSVLFAYSFAFLYEKTGEEIWKKRAKDISRLYWNLRDYNTNLVFNCFYHATNSDAGKIPGISSTGKYAYWMYKTGEILNDADLKEIAKKLLMAYQKYGWDDEKQVFYNSVQLDGKPIESSGKATAWKIGYGSSSLFSYARAATYIAKKEGNKEFIEIARQCEKQIPGSELPEQYTALNLGEAINFYADLYELTNDNYYFNEAKKYAEKGLINFCKNGLFSRQVNDRYYEAKLGIGDLLAGFFRLGIIEEGKTKMLEGFDFSY